MADEQTTLPNGSPAERCYSEYVRISSNDEGAYERFWRKPPRYLVLVMLWIGGR